VVGFLARSEHRTFRSYRTDVCFHFSNSVSDGGHQEGIKKKTYGSGYGGNQQLPVLDDVQICDGIRGFGEHIAKESQPWRSRTSVKPPDRAVARAGVH
jgi:hypothetical protein